MAFLFFALPCCHMAVVIDPVWRYDPGTVTSFTSGQRITVDLYRDSGIYYRGSYPEDVRCAAFPEAEILSPPLSEANWVTVDGVKWKVLFHFDGTTYGRHQITCLAGPDTTFALGSVYSRHPFIAVALFMLGFLIVSAFAVAVVVTIILLSLRRTARARY